MTGWKARELRVRSDNPWGLACVTRIMGEKKVRETWFPHRPTTEREAVEMGRVDQEVSDGALEQEEEQRCGEILILSPAL